MASRPPTQRPSPPSSQRSASHSSSPAQSPGSIRSIDATRDEETVLLDPAPSSRHQSSSQRNSSATSQPTTSANEDSEDVRKCWICFSDATEDSPNASRWRNPCPCSLTAHEACLLDWVANIEASNSGRKKKIECPQCKSEIIIVRPRSLMVDFVTSLEYGVSRLVLPTILTIGSSTVVYMSLSYGVLAVRTVLGHDDFLRIFGEPVNSQAQVIRRVTGITLIPGMLILSRTSLADSILPIIPMFYFITQPKPDPIVEFSTWPPSAGLSFALLPYVRAAYNTYYEHVWAPHERRWIEEVSPRSSSGSRNNDDVAGMEIEIGLEDVGDDDGEQGDQDEQEANAQAEHAPPLNAPPLNEVAPGLPVNAILGVNVEARHEVVVNGEQRQGGRRDISISISRITKSILGALVFPGVSAIMGDLLRVALPQSWTALSPRQKPTKFLQTRWGRSIVGGCLFVVLKDAVTLYVRWKMAQTHRKRTIANFKGRSVR
jgi:RING-variant domain